MIFFLFSSLCYCWCCAHFPILHVLCTVCYAWISRIHGSFSFFFPLSSSSFSHIYTFTHTHMIRSWFWWSTFRYILFVRLHYASFISGDFFNYTSKCMLERMKINRQKTKQQQQQLHPNAFNWIESKSLLTCFKMKNGQLIFLKISDFFLFFFFIYFSMEYNSYFIEYSQKFIHSLHLMPTVQ